MTAETSWPIRTATERQGTRTAPIALEFAAVGPTTGATWREVEARLGRPLLTASWDWTETWLRHYGDAVPHRVAIARDAAGPCGIALITTGAGQRRGPLPVRTRHIGTAGEPAGESVCVEVNRLLVIPEQRAQFLAALVRALRRDRIGWDVVELNGFAPEELDGLRELEPGFRCDLRPCYYVDLAAARATGKDPVELLTKGIASKIRKNLRRFEESYGPLRADWIENEAAAMSAYDELVRLHQVRWLKAGHPGSFASARFLSFHRDLIRRLLPVGQVVLYRVIAGEQTVGVFYGFVERGVIVHYQWGLEQFAEHALSPGFVIGALLMREGSARGYDELNWLAGDVRYKRELSNASRDLVWAEWHRGPWMAAVDGLIAAKAWWRSRRGARLVATAEAGA